MSGIVNFFQDAYKNIMDPKGSVNPRTMKYPVTTLAQIRQFPFKHYFTKQIYWKFWGISLILCFPIFYKIQKLSYSPENVAKYNEFKRKEREHH